MEPCWFMRSLNHKNHVVQLENTGAILLVELKNDLDMSKAMMVSPMNPSRGKIGLGPYVGYKFIECELDVTWNEPSYPVSTRPRKRDRNTK